MVSRNEIYGLHLLVIRFSFQEQLLFLGGLYLFYILYCIDLYCARFLFFITRSWEEIEWPKDAMTLMKTTQPSLSKYRPPGLNYAGYL